MFKLVIVDKKVNYYSTIILFESDKILQLLLTTTQKTVFVKLCSV